eukprot:COSAG01_NODE_60491_length_294_cov_1.225641_1_plen_54_part_01
MGRAGRYHTPPQHALAHSSQSDVAGKGERSPVAAVWGQNASTSPPACSAEGALT